MRRATRFVTFEDIPASASASDLVTVLVEAHRDCTRGHGIEVALYHPVMEQHGSALAAMFEGTDLTCHLAPMLVRWRAFGRTAYFSRLWLHWPHEAGADGEAANTQIPVVVMTPENVPVPREPEEVDDVSVADYLDATQRRIEGD